jgi:hypothetical protein
LAERLCIRPTSEKQFCEQLCEIITSNGTCRFLQPVEFGLRLEKTPVLFAHCGLVAGMPYHA